MSSVSAVRGMGARVVVCRGGGVSAFRPEACGCDAIVIVDRMGCRLDFRSNVF